MALRPDREIIFEDISFFMNETGERGVVVVYDTSVTASGSAMDDANAKVKTPGVGNASGSLPAGVLMNDVVNLDLTRQHINQHKEEVQINNKVTLLKEGWIVTNKVSGTPTLGS